MHSSTHAPDTHSTDAGRDTGPDTEPITITPPPATDDRPAQADPLPVETAQGSALESAEASEATGQDKPTEPEAGSGASPGLLLGVRVRAMTEQDVATTAAWQVRYLPHGFFPRLGETFVRDWHATYLGSPHGVALVAELVGLAEPLPVGYLLGASDQVAHVQHTVATHRRRLARAGVLALLRRPRLAATFARTRAVAYATRLLPALGGQGHDAASPRPRSRGRTRPVAVVTAVAVTGAARGSGVGEALLSAFVARARTAGAERAELVTKADGGAAGFYRRQGWQQVAARRDRDGSRVLTFRTDLADEAVAPPAGDVLASATQHPRGQR